MGRKGLVSGWVCLEMCEGEVCLRLCMYVCVFVYVCVCACVCERESVYVYVCVCFRECLGVCVLCVLVRVCVFV